MKKKKILFIIWSFTYGGGAEKILANIVNNMDSNKYDIDVIEYFNANIKKEKVNKNVNILKPVLSSDSSMFKRKLYFLLLLIFPSLIRKKYIKNKYDIEVAFNYMIPTFLLSKNKNTKKISWIHSSIEDLKFNFRNRFFQKKSLKNVDNIIAISEKTYNSIIDVYPEFAEKISLVYNGYNFEEFRKKSLDINIKLPKNNILFINRFDDNKNPLLAIEIAKRLLDKKIDFSMSFIGKGELEDEMNNRIKLYNLEKNVRILGYKNNPYPYIKNSKIVICTSKAEGFPTIFAESLSFGVPFISFPVGGSNELSNNQKCGLIVDNLDQFVEAIIELLNNKEKYEFMKKEAQRFIKNFTIEKQINSLEEIIGR